MKIEQYVLSTGYPESQLVCPYPSLSTSIAITYYAGVLKGIDDKRSKTRRTGLDSHAQD
jgi:hypothetical protein